MKIEALRLIDDALFAITFAETLRDEYNGPFIDGFIRGIDHLMSVVTSNEHLLLKYWNAERRLMNKKDKE